MSIPLLDRVFGSGRERILSDVAQVMADYPGDQVHLSAVLDNPVFVGKKEKATQVLDRIGALFFENHPQSAIEISEVPPEHIDNVVINRKIVESNITRSPQSVTALG